MLSASLQEYLTSSLNIPINYWFSMSIIVQTSLIVAVVGLLRHFLFRKRYRLPPGPSGLPLLGNILSFRGKTVHGVLKNWARKYGPVMMVNLGPFPCVVLSTHDAVQEALVKKATDFSGRPYIYSGSIISQGGNDIAFCDYGPMLKLRRKLAIKAIRKYMSGTTLEKFVFECVNIMCDSMMKEKGPFCPKKYTSFVTYNTLHSACFSSTLNIEDEEFIRIAGLIDNNIRNFGNGFWEDFIPPLRLCPTRKLRECKIAFASLLTWAHEKVRQCRESFNPEDCRNLTDSILLGQLQLADSEDGGSCKQLTDTQLVHLVLEVFSAGIDTSRNTLTWFLLFMASYPQVQAKVQEEVDKAFGTSGRSVQVERESLPYTEAVLYEVMRMGTVAPLAFLHKTMCDTSVGEYEIPEGMTVIINLWALHFDEDKWENPEVFKPERFLDADCKMIPKPDSWMPFSTGRRVCMGESVAKPSLHLIVANMMRRLRVKLEPGTTATFEYGWSVITGIPKPFKIVVEERQ